MSLVEIRPQIPYSVARFDSVRFDAEFEDWVSAVRREEELDHAMFAADAAALDRQRIVGRVRLVAFVTLVCSVVAVIRLGATYGIGVGLLGAWVLPVVVLGVVLSVEKLLLRLSR